MKDTRQHPQRDSLTIEVTSQLSLFLAVFIQPVHLQLLPLQLILLLDLQVTVQLSLSHWRQPHLQETKNTTRDSFGSDDEEGGEEQQRQTSTANYYGCYTTYHLF